MCFAFFFCLQGSWGMYTFNYNLWPTFRNLISPKQPMALFIILGSHTNTILRYRGIQSWWYKILWFSTYDGTISCMPCNFKYTYFIYVRADLHIHQTIDICPVWMTRHSYLFGCVRSILLAGVILFFFKCTKLKYRVCSMYRFVIFESPPPSGPS